MGSSNRFVCGFPRGGHTPNPGRPLRRPGFRFLACRKKSLARQAGRAFGADDDEAVSRQQENRTSRRAPTRLKALDDQIEQVSLEERFAPVVGRLRAFRGIDTLTAMTLIAELHDFMRFDSARGLMAFLGLVPSEHSSGGKEQRGQITKAGNGHVRRLLIEAAWHYRHRPSVVSLRKRREGVPAEVVALADKAMTRLHRRFNRFLERGKARPKVVVAIARELTGFVWAAMRSQTV